MAGVRDILRNLRGYSLSGFGSNPGAQGDRLLNKDGSFNVRKTGMPWYKRLSVYHSLISMSWWRFFGVIFLFYVLVNLLFASLYTLIGIEQINGMEGAASQSRFLNAFFFSTQTFTTVGYGYLNPGGVAANITASIEAMVGLLSFALATGLLYGRFSRPQARILFSHHAVVAPYREMSGLMVRIANVRDSQVTDVRSQMLFSAVITEENGPVRRFFNLDLEIDKINMLATSWTVVHPISEESPLAGLNASDLEQMDAELIVLVNGFDETYNQAVNARSSYKWNEMVFGVKFQPMMHRQEGGATRVELDKIGLYKRV